MGIPLIRYIDISLPITSDLPSWPGSPDIRMDRRLDMRRGDQVNDTTLHFSAHTGTHVDAPLHVLPDGKNIAQVPLDVLVGPAIVAWLPDVETITANVLDALNLPVGIERLLLRTRNSEWWARGLREFRTDYVALTADAAKWVVERGIHLVGVDYLSVQRFNDGPEVHLVLLRAGVVTVEGLNLSGVTAGEYELLCLPIRLEGVEGGPARALLRPIDLTKRKVNRL